MCQKSHIKSTFLGLIGVVHFLPPREDSSARYFLSSMTVPEPFTALAWDIEVHDPDFAYRALQYSSIPDIAWLSRFGRPYWFALWASGVRLDLASKYEVAGRIIRIAMNKLHGMDSWDSFRERFQDLPTLIRKMGADEKEIYVLTC